MILNIAIKNVYKNNLRQQNIASSNVNLYIIISHL